MYSDRAIKNVMVLPKENRNITFLQLVTLQSPEPKFIHILVEVSNSSGDEFH